MTDRPILFSAPMVRAILDGSKTQTRRVIKPQPSYPNMCESSLWFTHRPRCPYGQPGDRLWVRETQAKFHPAVYMADVEEGLYPSYLWTPSTHMPRAASRITLEITGVRVERVQDITEADAMAEGADPTLVDPDGGSQPHVEGFTLLWDSINAPRGFGWDTNPFVWSLEFRRVRP